VTVEAGARWSEVLRATLAQGKTPPVLTGYLELSVGGTLIAGGVGVTTSAFVRIPAASDANEANRLVDANKATYGRVKAAGGTLYPVSALPMSKGEWRDHFGSAFGQLDAAKQQYDPDEILTPGYEIF
jgi:FAD/FMN-containing dehydrogenase